MRTFLIITILTVLSCQTLHSHISLGSSTYDSYNSTEHADDHTGEECFACNVSSPKFQNHYPSLIKKNHISAGFTFHQSEPVLKDSFIPISIPPRSPPIA